jgi:hypothetical protein
VQSTVAEDPRNPLAGPHRFYVNEAGLGGLAVGGPYAEGTVFPSLVYEVERDYPLVNEGPGAAFTLMKKDTSAKETGGWRFAKFRPDGSQVAVDQKADCFECHTQVEDLDYVFSRLLGIGVLTHRALGRTEPKDQP